MSGPGVVHKEVAKVAKAAAGEHYEVLMRDNLLHNLWLKQNPGLTSKQLESRFIAKSWPLYVRFARSTMSLLLGRPGVDEKTKEAIYEALLQDGTLTIGRKTPAEAQRLLWGDVPNQATIRGFISPHH